MIKDELRHAARTMMEGLSDEDVGALIILFDEGDVCVVGGLPPATLAAFLRKVADVYDADGTATEYVREAGKS